ncbi:MAG TPA: hypothetical protein VH253_10675 [Phycisphaerae bacterium]|nr:hypothetical protein [Phycisphaerae bacterium]
MLALRRPIFPSLTVRAALVTLAATAIALPALLFLTFAALVEITDFSTLPPHTYFLAAALLAASLLLLILACPRRRFILAAAACFTLYAASLTALALVPWGPGKTFVSRLNHIQPGMTVPEVDRIMAGYPRGQGSESGPISWGPGTAASPTPQVILFRHDITDARYDADIGEVHLHNGRVTSTDFLPD